jgi:pimeloyl-ACP methyl ester carboxylesterase
MVTVDRADADTPMMVTAVSMDGTKITSWRSGTGPALVLVHGTAMDHRQWDGVVPELAPYFSVYAMDRRGRGASGDGPAFAIEREVEDVVAVVNDIGDPVHIIGSSYGAICSLEAARRTQRIASLVLYEPPLLGGMVELPPGFLDEVERLSAEGRREEAAVQVYQTMMGLSPEVIEQLRADPGWANRVASVPAIPREVRAVQGYRFNWNAYRDMDRRTLLLDGELSPPPLRASTAAVDAILSHSRVVVLHGQGHGAVRFAPKLVAAEVLAFLRSATE